MHKQFGFSIIEMIIALVIGSFMLLVVFLAVPAAQRSARNSERHKDAAALLAAVLDHKTQTRDGRLPDSCNNTQAGCLTKVTPLAYYDNQSTTDATVSFVRLERPYVDGDALLHAGDSDAAEKVALYSYAICNDEGTAPTGQYASPQSVVVQSALETFNGVAMQCKEI